MIFAMSKFKPSRLAISIYTILNLINILSVWLYKATHQGDFDWKFTAVISMSFFFVVIHIGYIIYIYIKFNNYKIENIRENEIIK